MPPTQDPPSTPDAPQAPSTKLPSQGTSPPSPRSGYSSAALVLVNCVHRRPSSTAPAPQMPPRELTGFSPRIDQIFPSSTSKRYSKGWSLGFRAENLGVG